MFITKSNVTADLNLKKSFYGELDVCYKKILFI